MYFVFSAIFISVYPKVKVRTEGQDDQHAHAAHEYNWNSLLSLKDIQFLLLQDSYFPGTSSSCLFYASLPLFSILLDLYLFAI